MHEITLVSPFPGGEGGRGDRGQKSKLKTGAAGDKEGKPPPGYPLKKINLHANCQQSIDFRTE